MVEQHGWIIRAIKCPQAARVSSQAKWLSAFHLRRRRGRVRWRGDSDLFAVCGMLERCAYGLFCLSSNRGRTGSTHCYRSITVTSHWNGTVMARRFTCTIHIRNTRKSSLTTPELIGTTQKGHPNASSALRRLPHWPESPSHQTRQKNASPLERTPSPTRNGT